MAFKIAEADLKYGAEEYLQYGSNLRKWIFFRLNSGDFFIQEKGKARRRIKGTPKGTADFEVIRHVPGTMRCRIIFLETKSSDGRQRPEQIEFQKRAEAEGAEYYLVKDLDELMSIVPMDIMP